MEQSKYHLFIKINEDRGCALPSPRKIKKNGNFVQNYNTYNKHVSISFNNALNTYYHAHFTH